MAKDQKRTGSGGKRKYGRNSDKCKKYKLYNMHDRNRDRRVARIRRGFRSKEELGLA